MIFKGLVYLFIFFVGYLFLHYPEFQIQVAFLIEKVLYLITFRMWL